MKCDCKTPPLIELCDSGVHYAKRRCPIHGFQGWEPKPDEECAVKRKRPASQRELADKHGSGFCEMCCLTKDELPKGQTLVGHHVIEYQVGGTEERENIWVVCTSCHQLIHHQRHYHGKVFTEVDLNKMFAQNLKTKLGAQLKNGTIIRKSP